MCPPAYTMLVGHFLWPFIGNFLWEWNKIAPKLASKNMKSLKNHCKINAIPQFYSRLMCCIFLNRRFQAHFDLQKLSEKFVISNLRIQVLAEIFVHFSKKITCINMMFSKYVSLSFYNPKKRTKCDLKFIHTFFSY